LHESASGKSRGRAQTLEITISDSNERTLICIWVFKSYSEDCFSLRNFSFTPLLQRGASAASIQDRKPFKRFPILFAVLTPG